MNHKYYWSAVCICSTDIETTWYNYNYFHPQTREAWNTIWAVQIAHNILTLHPERTSFDWLGFTEIRHQQYILHNLRPCCSRIHWMSGYQIHTVREEWIAVLSYASVNRQDVRVITYTWKHPCEASLYACSRFDFTPHTRSASISIDRSSLSSHIRSMTNTRA